MHKEFVELVCATEKALSLIDGFTMAAQNGQVPSVTIGAFVDIMQIRNRLEAAQRLTSHIRR